MMDVYRTTRKLPDGGEPVTEYHIGDRVSLAGPHVFVVVRENNGNGLVWIDCTDCEAKLAARPDALTLISRAIPTPPHVHDWWTAVLLDKETGQPTIHDFWMCPSCGATSPGPTDNEALDPRVHPSSSVHQGGTRDGRAEDAEHVREPRGDHALGIEP